MDQRMKPALVVMDPTGPGSATAVELQARYARDYLVVAATSAPEAVAELHRLRQRQVEVAVVLSDRAAGADVLEAARAHHPHARRAMLLGWNESRSHREEIAAAFARRQAECVVTKPGGAPDERFHRTITELLDEWWRMHGSPAAGVRIIGVGRSPRVSEICDSLQRHDVAYAVHTPVSDAGRRALEEAGVTADRLPVIVLRNGRTLVDPSNLELASALGARTRPGAGTYDVVVVGGGPAGLSAAVYAESEGLRTAVIEPTAMGGQAGTSSMIRNYLGFPRGISGAELGTRAFEQAILFGTEMVYGGAAADLGKRGDLRLVTLGDGTEVPARSVVIATGVSYRRLGLPSLEALIGAGVYYGAAMSEAPTLTGRDVFVVGGGNSAGQAAVHLATYARHVTIVVRSDSLAASMSNYLVTEIDVTPNIDVRYCTEVVGGGGNGSLENLELADRRSGTVTSEPAAALFVLIGAEPFTDWLPPEVARDDWGYVITGPDADDPQRLPFESHMPGVFAIGDVRRDSVKRVASAAGEGAVVISLIHQYLDGLRAPT
jgi:thioredoxin reductase (NADPH)